MAESIDRLLSGNGTDTLRTMTNWPLAVLFDFDGVIVNSEPLHFYAFHKVLEAEKIELSEEEYYRELIGFDDRGAFRHLFEKRKMAIEPENLSRLMTRKSEVVMELIEEKKYQALPGVEELVRGLWRHYPLAICSGASRRNRSDAGGSGIARLLHGDRGGRGCDGRQAGPERVFALHGAGFADDEVGAEAGGLPCD